MQAGLVVVLLAGLLFRRPSVVVNALLALAVTVLPAVLARNYRVILPPGLVLPLTATVLLHTVGMLGVYESVWWWDALTHVLSATLVAAAGYAVVHAVDLHADSLSFPDGFLVVFVFLCTVALGVLWEVFEFAARGLATLLGFGPVLIQYGLADTMADLLYDIVGAVVGTSFAIPTLRGFVRSLADRLDDVRG